MIVQETLQHVLSTPYLAFPKENLSLTQAFNILSWQEKLQNIVFSCYCNK